MILLRDLLFKGFLGLEGVRVNLSSALDLDALSLINSFSFFLLSWSTLELSSASFSLTLLCSRILCIVSGVRSLFSRLFEAFSSGFVGRLLLLSVLWGPIVGDPSFEP